MTIKKEITINELVDFLNSLLMIDEVCLNSLFSMRISCNEDLAKHPTVQVARIDNLFPIVGIIGILNGLFGEVNGCGAIAAETKDGEVTGFRILDIINEKEGS
jgi:hypothetical protein